MMYYEELVLRYLTLKNQGTRYVQANIQDYMDNYLENQCKKFDESTVNVDRQLFENIIRLMLSLSEDIANLSQIDISELGQKIAELKEREEFAKYVGSASSNPTSITNKVKIAKQVLLGISEA